MCVVSDKIKFCSCEVGSYEELPHYWILYRFNKQKNVVCIGETLWHSDAVQPNYQLNKQTLETRLNECNAFDKEIEFKTNDQLQIVINNLSDNEQDRLTFCFVYQKGRWHETEYDYFELTSQYDELGFGTFKELSNE